MQEADFDDDSDEGAVGGIPAGGGGGFGWGNFAPGGQYQPDDGKKYCRKHTHNEFSVLVTAIIMVFLLFPEGHFMGAGHVLAGQGLNPDNMPHHQRSPAQLAGKLSVNFNVGNNGQNYHIKYTLIVLSMLILLVLRYIEKQLLCAEFG